MFFLKEKTAYEMGSSDWSSDVCSSDLPMMVSHIVDLPAPFGPITTVMLPEGIARLRSSIALKPSKSTVIFSSCSIVAGPVMRLPRSEEHTSELQSLMRISYAVFCLKKKNHTSAMTATYTINQSNTSKRNH